MWSDSNIRIPCGRLFANVRIKTGRLTSGAFGFDIRFAARRVANVKSAPLDSGSSGRPAVPRLNAEAIALTPAQRFQASTVKRTNADARRRVRHARRGLTPDTTSSLKACIRQPRARWHERLHGQGSGEAIGCFSPGAAPLRRDRPPQTRLRWSERVSLLRPRRAPTPAADPLPSELGFPWRKSKRCWVPQTSTDSRPSRPS